MGKSIVLLSTKSLVLLAIFLSVFVPCVDAQTLDTLVDVGGYKLHFAITPGKGIPILFEAGGGDDATTWNNIIRPIFDITHTTLIAYDRIGFGKSGLDSNQHGIVKMADGLETGLRKLGYWGNIILVAHSQGAIYAQFFAFRHPDLVKAVVLIDGTTPCFYEPRRLAATQRSIDAVKNKWREKQPGMYYMSADFSANINVAGNSPFPIILFPNTRLSMIRMIFRIGSAATRNLQMALPIAWASPPMGAVTIFSGTTRHSSSVR